MALQAILGAMSFGACVAVLLLSLTGPAALAQPVELPALEAAALEDPKPAPQPLPAVEVGSRTVHSQKVADIEPLVEASTEPMTVTTAPESAPAPEPQIMAPPEAQPAPILPEPRKKAAAPMPMLGDETEELAEPDGRAPKKFWMERLLGPP